MKLNALSRILLASAVCLVSALAADINGKWKSTFDTQIGEQKYTYELKADGENLTGKAINGEHSSNISEGKIKGDDVSFVEMFNYQGTDIRIEYTGKIAGDEIKFTRKVGEFAVEQIVATREK